MEGGTLAMNKPHFLVLTGDGINCDRETALAFRSAGGLATIMHINDLLQTPKSLHQYDGLAIPGGFSFGDDLGSGRILALKIKYALNADIQLFVKAQKPIIGICNGFQVLTQLGLLPDYSTERSISLAPNIQGQFLNRWVSMTQPEHSICTWTTGISHIQLPVRHAEGRLVCSSPSVLSTLQRNGQIALQYTEDINGSTLNIAGICDPTGLIFGLMPHPEAFLFQETAPHSPTTASLLPADGLLIFQNIITHCQRAAS
jgi:phosphoribosylformylglycinamidine synthase